MLKAILLSLGAALALVGSVLVWDEGGLQASRHSARLAKATVETLSILTQATFQREDIEALSLPVAIQLAEGSGTPLDGPAKSVGKHAEALVHSSPLQAASWCALAWVTFFDRPIDLRLLRNYLMACHHLAPYEYSYFPGRTRLAFSAWYDLSPAEQAMVEIDIRRVLADGYYRGFVASDLGLMVARIAPDLASKAEALVNEAGSVATRDYLHSLRRNLPASRPTRSN